MYNKFNVTLKFRDKIFGGLPKSEKLIMQYIDAKFRRNDLANGLTLAESQARDTDLILKDMPVIAEIDEQIEMVTTGFKRDERGIYLGDYIIKAGLKQYASLMRLTIKKRGTAAIAGLKDSIAEATFVKGLIGDEMTYSKIYFQPLSLEPSGMESFAGHVMGPQGKRSILKQAEFMESPTIQFQLWSLAARMRTPNELTADDLRNILEFGGEVGYGSCRSFEHGKFDVIQFEAVVC